MGQPQPLKFIFHRKDFYNNDLQTGIPYRHFCIYDKRCAPSRLISSHRRESWVGVTACLLGLHDREATIITQTVVNTMFLCWCCSLETNFLWTFLQNSSTESANWNCIWAFSVILLICGFALPVSISVSFQLAPRKQYSLSGQRIQCLL